jgi:uncharacterized RDD family membrane protein YckC
MSAEFSTPGTNAGPSGPRASFGIRFVAYLIDVVIIIIFQIILIAILGRMAGQGLGTLASIAYLTYFEGSPSGQSPGKRAMNIRVIDFETGGSIGFSKALIRNIVRLASGIVCLLGYLWMLWDKEKQTWHDKVAASVVVPTSDYPVDKWPG